MAPWLAVEVTAPVCVVVGVGTGVGVPPPVGKRGGGAPPAVFAGRSPSLPVSFLKAAQPGRTRLSARTTVAVPMLRASRPVVAALTESSQSAHLQPACAKTAHHLLSSGRSFRTLEKFAAAGVLLAITITSTNRHGTWFSDLSRVGISEVVTRLANSSR